MLAMKKKKGKKKKGRSGRRRRRRRRTRTSINFDLNTLDCMCCDLIWRTGKQFFIFTFKISKYTHNETQPTNVSLCRSAWTTSAWETRAA